MSKKSDDSKKIRWWPWLLFPGVMILWGISIVLLPEWFSTPAERGEFGDSFGGVNALFSGLAFAGVIWAILLQREELALQRKELANTRGEMKEQKRAIQKESFERSFFQFLEILDTKYNSMEYKIHSDKIYKGTEAFGHAVLENQPFKICYYMNPYFSLLLKLLRFIDQADFSENFEEKIFYTDILRDRMTNDELILFFLLGTAPQLNLGAEYNRENGKILKELIEKYSLFLNIILYRDDLLEKATFYDRSAFGDREHTDIDEIFEQNQRKKQIDAKKASD